MYARKGAYTGLMDEEGEPSEAKGVIEEVDEEVDGMSTLANRRAEKRERKFKKSV